MKQELEATIIAEVVEKVMKIADIFSGWKHSITYYKEDCYLAKPLPFDDNKFRDIIDKLDNAKFKSKYAGFNVIGFRKKNTTILLKKYNDISP